MLQKISIFTRQTPRGFWGGWGSLRGNYGNAFLRFAAERLGPFLPRAATQRAAEGRARQATQEPYGHRQQSKGVPSPSR